MAEKQIQEPTPQAKEPSRDIFALTRRLLLAGVGAVALAYDEMEAFVDRLVERGELAREQGQDLLKEVREKKGARRLHETGERLRERVAQSLEPFDLPRRSDVTALQERLDRLSAQVEALLQKREGQD